VLTDFALLERCRVRPTSLLRLNCELLPRTGRFLPAAALAAYVDGDRKPEGGGQAGSG
jgi:hypothetical protein